MAKLGTKQACPKFAASLYRVSYRGTGVTGDSPAWRHLPRRGKVALFVPQLRRRHMPRFVL